MSRSRLEASRALLVAALSLPLTGCLERLLQIRSEPPGSEVYINGEQVLIETDGEPVPATTPVDVEFDDYGTFEIQLRRPDYSAQSRLVAVAAPFYDYPPLDLILDFLWPWTLRDDVLVEFRLEPAPEFSEQEKDAMIERLEKTRALLQGPGEENGKRTGE